MGGHLDLALLIDEDVLGTHIAHFLTFLVELVSSHDENVSQIPEFGFCEEIILQILPVLDLYG